jgi:hypothetical protein
MGAFWHGLNNQVITGSVQQAIRAHFEDISDGIRVRRDA